MEKNELFKEQISDRLYDDVLEFFSKLHKERKTVEETLAKIKSKSKLHTVTAVIGAGVGLVTVGMALTNHFELYEVSKDAMKVGAFSSLAVMTANTQIYKGINALRAKYLSMLDKGPIQEFNQYREFENRLVSDLKAYGLQVEVKDVKGYFDYAELRDFSQSKLSIDNEVKSKVAEYVKDLMDEYTEPQDTVKKRKKNTP